MIADRFLLVKEAAAFLGIAPNTVRKWAAEGKLREFRHPINNYRLFRKEDVEALRKRINNPVPQQYRRHTAKAT